LLQPRTFKTITNKIFILLKSLNLGHFKRVMALSGWTTNYKP